jgi:hypothetical protein
MNPQRLTIGGLVDKLIAAARDYNISFEGMRLEKHGIQFQWGMGRHHVTLFVTEFELERLCRPEGKIDRFVDWRTAEAKAELGDMFKADRPSAASPSAAS